MTGVRAVVIALPRVGGAIPHPSRIMRTTGVCCACTICTKTSLIQKVFQNSLSFSWDVIKRLIPSVVSPVRLPKDGYIFRLFRHVMVLL